MKKSKSIIALVILLMMMAVTVTSQPQEVIVVASTSWTGAIAKAAGADEVRVLAPLELKHPPEYDFRPGDLQRLVNADFLVWAGYEPFITRLQESAGLPPEQVVKVLTTNTPSNLVEQVTYLGEVFGTKKVAENWVKEFTSAVELMEKRAQESKLSEKRVVVQMHQEGFVRWLGFDVVGVFSAEELSPAKIIEFASLKPDLVIDNFHNPQGKGISEVAGVPRIEIRNFPGEADVDISVLFKENWTKLASFWEVEE